MREERRRRGRMGSRESGWTPSYPTGGTGKPVEKSDERSQHGSPRDWEYRLLRRLRRERKAGPGSRSQGADREVWVVDERKGRRRGEERRGGGVREME
jgi:hypothetical protein